MEVVAGLRVHPGASIFPMMSEPEITELAADISERGLRVPILITDDSTPVVLDGRNRLLACQAAGVAPSFRVYEGDDPISEIRSINLLRRHLTTSQRAMCAARALEIYQEAAKQRQGARHDLSEGEHGGKVATKSRDAAGADFGVSGRSVDKAREVQQSGEADLVAAVDRGEMSVTKAQSEVRARAEANASKESKGSTLEVDGLVVDPAQSQWFTSRQLADRLVAALDGRPVDVLEPAAGSGVLIRALHARFGDQVPVVAVEKDARWANRLEDTMPPSVEVVCGDGLEVQRGFHWALLNPPYEGGADVRFLRHAMDHARCVAGVFRSNILHGVGAHESIWSDKAWSWQIKLLVGRPRFSGTDGSPRHEFCVVIGRREPGPTQVEWWT